MGDFPKVGEYMTRVPKSIGFDQSIAKAQEVMRELRIRHLPVLKGGKLVGVLTDRDINLVLTFKDVNPETLCVDEAFTPDPYFATPDTLLKEVANRMAEGKFGCSIVLDHNKLVGIFTEIDAYRALAGCLKED
ncbi:MAG: CBS domain-containing protein [Bdellovibrionales bacterium]|nr:CBS domain-containing protein [Bdellovibrionales bacterium]